MKKKAILFILLLTCITITSAQYKNTFELGLGGYSLGGSVTYPNNELYSVFNAKYQRSLNDKWGIIANYTTASITGWAFDFENFIADTNAVGKIESRLRYQFLDLGISYKAVKYKNHSLSIGVAPSVAWGKNAYKTKLILAPGGVDGQGDIIDVQYMHKKEAYFGGVASIDYNYSFLKDRLQAGLSFYVRYYAGNMPSMYNYNFHLGVKL